MDIVGLLSLSTLGFVLVFSYLSIRGLQKLRNSNAPKSSLSRDGIEERLAAARQ